jgi:hypothetical protein
MVAKRNTFVEGNLLQFSCQFKDETTGDLVDPTEVAFGYRVAGGAITVFKYGTDTVLTRTSVGQYAIRLDSTNRAGIWVWEWQSIGVAQALTSGSISVTQSSMSLI